MAQIKILFFKQPSPLWKDVAALRMQVFVNEQGVPQQLELDEYDRQALHFCAISGSSVVGTLRLIPYGQDVKIGRVAVARSYRHKGLATRMMKQALGWCRQKSLSEVTLGSQVAVVPFYLQLGFTSVGGVFMDAGIPHQSMTRKV